MIAFYRRLVRNCQTVNQLNKVHIALENRMTPLELEALRSELPPAPPAWRILTGKYALGLRRRLPWVFKAARQGLNASPSARSWVDKLDLKYSPNEKSRPEPFVRRRVRKQVTVFETKGDRPHKMLAICFGGAAQRMMMPMPVFLQHIDAVRVDVAFVNDPKRNGYANGIGGVTDNLESSIDGFRELLSLSEYQRVVSIGTSGGGLPAVLTAVRLGLDAALSVGGGDPHNPRWLTTDGKCAGDLLRCYSSQSSVCPRLYLAFGADSPRDRVAAEALASIVPAELIPIADPSEPVGHNALYPLVQQGKLKEFLEATVFDSSRR